MEPPTSPDRCLLVLILRTLRCSQDDVASMVRIAKGTVGEVERWIQTRTFAEAAAICDDQAIKRIVGRELVQLQEVNHDILVRAGQVTGDDILRRHRSDYLEQRVKAIPDKYIEKHWSDLARVAGELAENLSVLLLADDKGNAIYRINGNVVFGGVAEIDPYMEGMWGEEFDSLVQLKRVDYILASALISHLKLPFSDWLELTTNTVTRKLIDDLKTAASRGTFEGTTCDICKGWS